jgi:hypothetical protein
MSAKSVPTFADKGCRVVNATDPHGRILGFLDRSSYYFFQVAPHFYSRGWVAPVPDPLLLRKSGSAGNRTRNLWICSHELWPLDHIGGLFLFVMYTKSLTCRPQWPRGLQHGIPSPFQRVGIVVSNPTRCTDVCVYSVFVLPCIGSGLATRLFPHPRSPTNCL